MAWPSLKTWTASVVTVLDLNTEIRDRMATLKTSIADNGDIAFLKGYAEKSQSVAPVAGVVTIDLANGNHVFVTLNANITSFAVSNSVSGILGGYVIPIVLWIVNDGTLRTITWTVDGLSVQFSDNVAPTLSGTNAKVDRVVLYFSSGTAVYGDQVGHNA